MGSKKRPIIAIHGGYTGDLHESKEMLERRQLALQVIITRAEDYMMGRGKDAGGKTHDAVETAHYAVRQLEDSGIFNAGVGAKFQGDPDKKGEANVRRSASFQDGNLEIGGRAEVVEGVTDVINIAYLEYKDAAEQKDSCFSPQLLVGAGATEYARKKGLKLEYITTRERLDEVKKHAEEQGKAETEGRHKNNGTVGCVVMDEEGHCAAATSTGGTTNNMPGRGGDSGTIAGNFANKLGAVSMTGTGEGIMNYAMAAAMLEQLKVKGSGAQEVVTEKFREAHGAGVSSAAIFIGQGDRDWEPQLICTDADAAMAFAYTRCDGKIHVFKNEPSLYYNDEKEAAAEGFGKDHITFAKKEHIGQPRPTDEIPVSDGLRQEWEKKYEMMQAMGVYRPTPFLPAKAVEGADLVLVVPTIPQIMEEARNNGRISGSK